MLTQVCLHLLFPLAAYAQYGYGPITSENGQNSTSTLPLTADQSTDLRGAGFILEYSVIGLAVETLLFGAFITLFIFSARILISKGMSIPSYRGMFAVICVMLGASASYWGVSLTLVINNLRDILVNHPDSSIADRFDTANQASLKLYLAEVYLPMVNYLLSDAVVVWRAWTLWPQRRWLLFPIPIFFLLGSFATTFVVGGMKVKAMTADSLELELALNYTQIVSWSLSLGTNFVATVLIALKAWKFRQNISRNIGESQGRVRVEKVLALLVESGVLYCCTQVALVVSWFLLLPDTTAWASDLFGAAAVQLAAIYPTVIIALVSLDSVILDVPRTRSPSATLSSGGVQTHLTFAPNPSTTVSPNVTSQKSIIPHSFGASHPLSIHLDDGSASLGPHTPVDLEKQ